MKEGKKGRKQIKKRMKYYERKNEDREWKRVIKEIFGRILKRMTKEGKIW